MFKQGLMIVLLLLAVATTVNAEEVFIQFKQGNPSAKEFVLAAKRTFYRRNYEIQSAQDDRVTGDYKGTVTMEIVLGDTGVTIRPVDVSNSYKKKIPGYIKNLQRDLVYELAEFLL